MELANRPKEFNWWILIPLVGISVVLLSIWIWTFPFKWALYGTLAVVFVFALPLIPNIKKFILGLTIFILPLEIEYNLITLPGKYGVNKIALGPVDVLLFLLLVMWIYDASRAKSTGHIRFFPAISVPSLFLILASVLSLINAIDRGAVAVLIFTFIKAFIFFWVLANTINSEDDLNFVVKIFLLTIVVQCLLFLLYFYTGETLAFLGIGEEGKTRLSFRGRIVEVIRPAGTLGHVASFIKYLLLFLPMAVTLSLYPKLFRYKGLPLIATFFGIMVLILSVLRGGWLAFVFAALFIPFLLFHYRLLSLKTIINIFIFVIILCCLVFYFNDIIVDRLTTPDKGSAHSRITTVKVAIKVIQDYPIFGVGLGNYLLFIDDYWISEDPFTSYALVHNYYFGLTSEMGLVGLSAFLWLLMAMFFRSCRILRSRLRSFRILGVGLIATMIAFLILSNTNIADYGNPILFMAFFGVAAIIESVNKLNEVYGEKVFQILENMRWTDEF